MKKRISLNLLIFSFGMIQGSDWTDDPFNTGKKFTTNPLSSSQEAIHRVVINPDPTTETELAEQYNDARSHNDPSRSFNNSNIDITSSATETEFTHDTSRTINDDFKVVDTKPKPNFEKEFAERYDKRIKKLATKVGKNKKFLSKQPNDKSRHEKLMQNTKKLEQLNQAPQKYRDTLFKTTGIKLTDQESKAIVQTNEEMAKNSAHLLNSPLSDHKKHHVKAKLYYANLAKTALVRDLQKFGTFKVNGNTTTLTMKDLKTLNDIDISADANKNNLAKINQRQAILKQFSSKQKKQIMGMDGLENLKHDLLPMQKPSLLQRANQAITSLIRGNQPTANRPNFEGSPAMGTAPHSVR